MSRNLDGVDVPAGARRRLVQGEIEVAKCIGGGEAGEAAADARKAHASRTLPRYPGDVREVDVDGLPGLLDKPRGATAAIVLAHGAGAGMRHAFMQDIADALAERKIATLRY